jgi:hypothetical protein
LDLPERVWDQMVVVEGVVDLAVEGQAAAAAAASEVLRTSVGYCREDRKSDRAEAVVGHVCCGSTVDRQVSRGSDEETSGL